MAQKFTQDVSLVRVSSQIDSLIDEKALRNKGELIGLVKAFINGEYNSSKISVFRSVSVLQIPSLLLQGPILRTRLIDVCMCLSIASVC